MTQCEIVLVDHATQHVFTPWLYEVASGSLAAHHCANHELRRSAGFPVTSLLGPKGGMVQFRHAKVTGLDVDTKHVVLDGGRTLAYDVLLVGLGSETAFFGIPGLQEHACTLKTLEDASAINCRFAGLVQALRKGERTSVHVLVGGAGPAGVELAAEMRTMLTAAMPALGIARDAVRISLVGAGSRVLEMAAPALSHHAKERLQQIGVEVLLDTVITRATSTHVTVQPRPHKPEEAGPSRSPFTGPTELSCDLLVWCGGIMPNQVLAHMPLPKDPKGRVQAGPTFEVVGHANIFVIGDAVCLVNPADPRPLPSTAHAAEVASATVAHNIIRAIQRKALRRFRMPKWPLVVMVGAKWGVASVGRLTLTGWPGYVLRRGADLRYFLRLLPPLQAVQLWRRRVKLYEQND